MIGTQLAHYQIVEQIGEGGMGTVYRARDTKLDRDVALKVLPREMSGDPERVARFQREARTLASLQHPNIAAIHGFDDVDGVRFLVMELVEGEDLSVRIARGPLGEDDAIEIVRKLAAALDAAHALSIVHRDLKPANIKITPEGDVKVLDFGLARAYAGDPETDGDPTLSPTITAAMTQAGTILGTAAYMSPEQARGRSVDQRSDIWAMGVILFEMLCGERLYEGETITDVLAAVITTEPDLDRLPASTSARTRRLLRRCLQRDPRRRIRAAADALLEFDDADDPSTEVAASVRGARTWIPWSITAMLVVVALLAMWKPGFRTNEPVAPRQYDLALDPSLRAAAICVPVISPNGEWVALALQDSVGLDVLVLRSLIDGETRRLEGRTTEWNPFWSPDSKYLGYAADGQLHKLHVETMSSQVIGASSQLFSRGASWSRDDQILFAPNANSGLHLTDADGADVVVVTQPDTNLVDGSHRWPKFLPDGRRFLFTLWSNLPAERASHGGIYLGSLDGTPPRRLLRDVSEAVYSPSGQILFHRDGRLMAVDFDLEATEIRGDARVVADKVGFATTNGQLAASVSNASELVHSAVHFDMDAQFRSTTLDGGDTREIGPRLKSVFGFVVDRQQNRYAIELIDDVGSLQVWVGDMRRGTFSRLSRIENDCGGVAFSPDGSEVAYVVTAGDQTTLYRHEVSGARDAQLVLRAGGRTSLEIVENWYEQDSMLVSGFPDQQGVREIYRVDLSTGEMVPVLADVYAHQHARVSPDGRWIAYTSLESGRPEVYARSWPDLTSKWQISKEGGSRPTWSPDGAELAFFAAATPEIRSVSFTAGAGDADISVPKRKIALSPDMRWPILSPHFDRLLFALMQDAGPLEPVKIELGWQ